jgi:hypothetical protein
VRSGQVSCGSGCEPFSGSCENGNETSYSTKVGEVFD